MTTRLRQQLAEFFAVVFLESIGHVQQHGIGFVSVGRRGCGCGLGPDNAA
jgi:hypothetical protein